VCTAFEIFLNSLLDDKRRNAMDSFSLSEWTVLNVLTSDVDLTDPSTSGSGNYYIFDNYSCY
jgi:hypothetical protein